MTLADTRDADALAPTRPPRVLVDLLAYGAVSATALGCDYGLLLLLVALGTQYLVAATISFCVGMALAYALSARFVFADRRAVSRRVEAVGFLGVGLAGLILTQVLIYLLVSRFGLAVGVAKIPTSGAVFAFGFVCRRGFVFTGPRALASS